MLQWADEVMSSLLSEHVQVIASYKPGDDVKLGLDAAQLRAQARRVHVPRRFRYRLLHCRGTASHL